MNNELVERQIKMLDRLFESGFSYVLMKAVRNSVSNLKQEDLEQLVNDTYVRIKSQIIKKGGLTLNEDTPEGLRAYCISSIINMALDFKRLSRNKNEVFTTDTGWKGGHVTGDEVSSEDVASRGWGSRPSSIEDRILLREVDEMFESPGQELGRQRDKKETKRLLDEYGGMGEINPTGESASFLDLAKHRMLEESGFDWDSEMMKAQEERDPVIREQKIDDLNEMIQRESNTLGKRTMRSWTSLNEWANRTNPVKKSNLISDLTNLVKVANKLDSLGLTKEADYIDFMIKKATTINKTAMYLGEGYLTCDECGTRYAEGKGGSRSGRGMDICRGCSGDISSENLDKKRRGAFESFKQKVYNLD
jgi:hypothetical protein